MPGCVALAAGEWVLLLTAFATQLFALFNTVAVASLPQEGSTATQASLWMSFVAVGAQLLIFVRVAPYKKELFNSLHTCARAVALCVHPLLFEILGHRGSSLSTGVICGCVVVTSLFFLIRSALNDCKERLQAKRTELGLALKTRKHVKQYRLQLPERPTATVITEADLEGATAGQRGSCSAGGASASSQALPRTAAHIPELDDTAYGHRLPPLGAKGLPGPVLASGARLVVTCVTSTPLQTSRGRPVDRKPWTLARGLYSRPGLARWMKPRTEFCCLNPAMLSAPR